VGVRGKGIEMAGIIAKVSGVSLEFGENVLKLTVDNYT
jgi:hypothetical protein